MNLPRLSGFPPPMTRTRVLRARPMEALSGMSFIICDCISALELYYRVIKTGGGERI